MEQIDTLLNGYKIVQDSERFMFGIDAVLLSNFALSGICKSDNVIDLGTGNGIIPLLLASSVNIKKITGLEIQEASAALAQKSVEINNLEKVQIVQGDIKNVSSLFPKHSFDVVTCNPPYMIFEHGKQNPTEPKAIARHEVLCSLADIVAAADYLLKPHGKFFMIHRPFRLPEIFEQLNAHKMEPKKMRLVAPSAGKEPNLVLIEARKNARAELKILPELPVYAKKCEYSSEIEEIYNSFKAD